MDVELGNVTANFRERIERLAIFDPLYRLENKKTTDKRNRPLDYFSLGLLALLFFFENMLLRNRNAGVKELAEFLQKINQQELELDSGGYEKLARDIIEAFRPPSGKRNARNFYNWQTRQEETVYYSILKADRFDRKNNLQYYSLDEQGLELIFATREYFSEFQVSINQLLLRKQLERGQFWGALRQIDEMRVAVETLDERIVRIRHEIQRNIVSEPTYQRYRDIVEEIHLRLQHEDQEFTELQIFVAETREHLAYGRSSAKDQQAYELIVKIDGELGKVHHQHGQLLSASIYLKTIALQAAQESLYYAGIDAFNFQKEITEPLLATPLPLTAARTLAAPFLFLERSVQWSPLTVFARQRIQKRRESGGETSFLLALEEENRQQERQLLGEQYRGFMELVLSVLGDGEVIELQDVIRYCRANEREDVLQSRSFYDFWILLHQRSPLAAAMDTADRQDSILGEALAVLPERVRRVVVIERGQVLKIGRRYSIRNLQFRLEE